jgi:hypothetical protein
MRPELTNGNFCQPAASETAGNCDRSEFFHARIFYEYLFLEYFINYSMPPLAEEA